MTDRMLVFVPAYNCEGQIGRVLDQLEAPWVATVVEQVVVVNNRSTDGTEVVVRKRMAERGNRFVTLLRNDDNYGLGGSHKVAFDYARAQGFDWLIVLHGDDQGSIADFREHLTAGRHAGLDAMLGSRFMPGADTPGYSAFRIFGNHVFNAIYSLCLGKRIRDLGAGLNLYRVASLDPAQYHRHPDNLTFNCVLLASQVISGRNIAFVPISWREDDQVSNVKLVRQSFQTLYIALHALFGRTGFGAAEHREQPRDSYTSTMIDDQI